MNVTVDFDPKYDHLGIYATIAEEKIAKTVSYDGEWCNFDLNKQGHIIGVEIVGGCSIVQRWEGIRLEAIRKIALRDYKQDVGEALTRIGEALKAQGLEELLA